MKFLFIIFPLIFYFNRNEAYLGVRKELSSLSDFLTPKFPFRPNRPERPQIGCPKINIDKCSTRGHCSVTIRELSSRIINPNFPMPDKCPQTYSHVIKTSNKTCGVRLDFLQMLLVANELDSSCHLDSLVVLSSKGPTKPTCGNLNNVQLNVPTVPGEDVEILITAQSKIHKWEIIANQLTCEEMENVDIYSQYSDLCGKYTGQDNLPAAETIKEIPNNFPLRNCKIGDFFRCHLEQIIENSQSKVKVDGKVINGVEAKESSWPFMAAILSDGTLMCGGSIISERFIMTAAHCVPDFIRVGLKKLIVALGAHNIETWEQSHVEYFKIKKMTVHNNYKDVENDIALIELEKKINFNKYISPACLPSNKDKLYDGEIAHLIGWGMISSEHTPSATLQQAKMPIVTNAKCTETWIRLGGVQLANLIKSTNLCAGGGAEAQQIHGASCHGDSGGPLLIKEETNGEFKWFQVGIVSFGPSGQCYFENEAVSVFTRTTHFADFLQMAYVKLSEDRLSSSLPTFTICGF